MKETGSDIAQMITKTLGNHDIPLADWRAPGYDNGKNMSGKCNGTHAIKK